MEKLKIIKKGIGIRGYHGQLDGRVVERCGDLLYVADSATVYRHDCFTGKLTENAIVHAVWVNDLTGTPLSMLLQLTGEEVTWKGAIVDGEGREIKEIEVKKYI